MIIVPLEHKHWARVQQIYQEGIDTNQGTFETQAPEWEEWDHDHLKVCRFVAMENNLVIGWVALSRVSSRPVYKGVAEVSIYIALDHIRKGVGKALLSHLIKESENSGFWTLQASIFEENPASISLHQKFGFRRMGVREKIAQQHGIWRDTVIYERRSKRDIFG